MPLADGISQAETAFSCLFKQINKNDNSLQTKPFNVGSGKLGVRCPTERSIAHRQATCTGGCLQFPA